jgi:hypothetical protein
MCSIDEPIGPTRDKALLSLFARDDEIHRQFLCIDAGEPDVPRHMQVYLIRQTAKSRVAGFCAVQINELDVGTRVQLGHCVEFIYLPPSLRRGTGPRSCSDEVIGLIVAAVSERLLAIPSRRRGGLYSDSLPRDNGRGAISFVRRLNEELRLVSGSLGVAFASSG